MSDEEAPAAGGGAGDEEASADDGSASDEAGPPAEAGWVREEVTYRGISRRLAAHYLVNLGGELVGTDDPAEATRVDGDGWRATLATETVKVGGSLTLTEVRTSFAGDPETLGDLLPRYKQKAMRAGG
ncbi:hypothetical protein GJ633_11595 [Halorubrum sp. CBA1125]|uniref:hypothetical protein n=1 Tax=Halorubrum sp. CBA1125 TaxID=2668072 RepID=UPI0012E7DBF7|nr:hypothetical protein [Halorubrum sp. CBA1125]MUW15220.1 hypothetical protein [Halorubrum sp. CBA1125]